MKIESNPFASVAAAGDALAPPLSAFGARTRSGIDADVAILRGRAEFEALAPEWVELEAECRGATFFQGAGWVRAVLDFEATRGNSEFDPVIVTLRRDGKLRAVLPLERITSSMRRMLVPLGDTYLQVSDALIADDLVARDALAPMLKAAINSAPVDVVSLQKVRADSRLAAGLGKPIRTGSETAAPFERLTDWKDFDEYFHSIRPKTRKNLRSSHNRLSRGAVLEHVVARDADETKAILLRTLAGRAGRLEEQGLTSRAFADPAFVDFCASLAGRDDVELMALSLVRDGQVLSDQWGFVHQGRYYIFMTSRDFGFVEESPGKLHMKDVMETAFARGIRTVDFMTPVMAYKTTWCREVTEVRDYALPVTLKGMVLIGLWDRLLRPLAKRLFLLLPKAIRQVLVKSL